MFAVVLIVLICVSMFLMIISTDKFWSLTEHFVANDDTNINQNGQCKNIGSNERHGWKCPNDYPVYTGVTIGSNGKKLVCNGGLADNTVKKSTIQTAGAKAVAYVSSSGNIADVRIIDSGSGYKTPPVVKLIGKGKGAIIKSIVSDGKVIGIILIDGGYGYENPPKVYFDHIDGDHKNKHSDNEFTYCHMCCKTPYNNQLQKNHPDDGILEERIKSNETKINNIIDKINQLHSLKYSSTSSTTSTTLPLTQELRNQQQQVESQRQSLSDKVNMSTTQAGYTELGVGGISKIKPSTFKNWVPLGQIVKTSDNWKLTLPNTIEVKTIKISTDNDGIGSFLLSIQNENLANVLKKTYSNIKTTTILIDNINVIGKVFNVNGKIPFTTIEIWGNQAEVCTNYMGDTNSLFLYNSCIKTQTSDTQNKQQILQQASAYDKLMADRNKEKQIQKEEATKKMDSVKKAQEIETLAADQAKLYGLPPPPSTFSNDEITSINQTLQKTDKVLTDEQKAQCMTLLTDATQLRNKSDDLGRLAENNPLMIDASQDAGKKAESAWQTYTTMCGESDMEMPQS
jgi:hypothetical protein